MRPGADRWTIRKYAGALGLALGYSAHSMRATFITTALENGAQLEDVQKAAGHRDPSTTKLYDRRGYNPEKRQVFLRHIEGRRSADRLAQNGLVGSSLGAAPRQLAVNDHARQTSDAVLFGSRRDVRLMHVMDFDVVVRAGNAPDQIDGFLTGRTTSSENFDLFSLTLNHYSFLLYKVTAAACWMGGQGTEP